MSLHLRRRAFGATLAAAATIAANGPAAAQDWPTRALRLIVPFPAGGGVDAVGRILAEHLTTALGQPVVVDNRAGAGGAIGVDSVVNSPPDGYTLAMTSPGNMTAGPVVRPTPYDPLELAHVARVVRSPLLLICREDLPAADFAALVAVIRAQPDAIRMASAGVGTGTHLAAELLNLRLGASMIHVPFRGTAPVLTELMAGRVDIFFSDTSAWPMVQQGRLRLLAVSTAARWSIAPDVPSVADLVSDFDIANWYGMIAPPGTPDAPRQRLFEEISRIVARPDVIEFLTRIGFEPAPMPAAEFTDFLRTEIETWRSVVQAANIRAD